MTVCLQVHLRQTTNEPAFPRVRSAGRQLGDEPVEPLGHFREVALQRLAALLARLSSPFDEVGLAACLRLCCLVTAEVRVRLRCLDLVAHAPRRLARNASKS